MDARIRPRTPPARAQTHIHTQHTASLARQRAEIIIFELLPRCIFIVAKRPFHVSRSIKLPRTAAEDSARFMFIHSDA
jgi:hypothetical protein